jgi:hypothetical protein
MLLRFGGLRNRQQFARAGQFFEATPAPGEDFPVQAGASAERLGAERAWQASEGQRHLNSPMRSQADSPAGARGDACKLRLCEGQAAGRGCARMG